MLPRFDLDQLPRRIVLSRKGSDAAWGGRPSLRVGRELVSLPIPESAARARAAEASGMGLRYGDLPLHPRLGALHGHLRQMHPERYVHLDPDLRPQLRPPAGRTRLTRPERLFGQEGAAERHLRNQEVGPGDLFLFFGWFREAKRKAGAWKPVGAQEHCVWGWLQIVESHLVADALAAEALSWAAHHPHVAHWERYDGLNRVYRARSRLSFAPELPGAGVFRWHPGLTLTQRCGGEVTRRAWCLPGFVRRTGLTYNQVEGPCSGAHTDEPADVPANVPERALGRNSQRGPGHQSGRAWGRVHLRSAPIGQEFVMPAGRAFRQTERAAVAAWLQAIFCEVR